MPQSPFAARTSRTECPGRSEGHQQALTSQWCQFIACPRQYDLRGCDAARQSSEFDFIHLENISTGNHASPAGGTTRETRRITPPTKQITVNVHVHHPAEFTATPLESRNGDVVSGDEVDQYRVSKECWSQRLIGKGRNTVQEFLLAPVGVDITHSAKISPALQRDQGREIHFRQIAQPGSNRYTSVAAQTGDWPNGRPWRGKT